MRIVRHPDKKRLHCPVVALGTFDGVHRGHQMILKAAVKSARQIGAHSAAITFDPHPQELIAPERGLKLLTTLAEREELFCRFGIESVVVVGFTPKMKSMAYAEFVERYLVKRLGVRHVFVGYDYAFGRDRSGRVNELKALGRKAGFGVTVIAPVLAGSQPIKSGRIRELVSQGKFNSAVKLLGHPYRITGTVIRGAGRGTKLGFPTANLKVAKDKLIPAEGVYFGYVDGKKCLVNIGSRPTFGAGSLLVEVHILHFDRSLRGKSIAVDLFSRLRDEKQFSDVNDLIAQIKKDVVRAQGM